MVQTIRLLGDPVLRRRCSPVKDFGSEATRLLIRDLGDTLADFRSRRGFGRGIAAPQIGSASQIIVLDFEIHGALINPKITGRSKRRFRLWDDCFSFPDIMVMVERSYAITVSYRDDRGRRRTHKAQGALSELLQHEIDHLNGVLAIDRALDSRHIILRAEYEKLTHRETMVM
jgi:peptide deformylase